MAEIKVNTSKAEEAAQSEATDSAAEQIPAYGDHISDDLYSEQIPNYQTGLPSFSEEVQEDIFPVPSAPDTSASEPPQSPSRPTPSQPQGPLSLTLDKALIFPNTIPATALYSLNFSLNTLGNSVTISRSVAGAARANRQSSNIVDKPLYDISRKPFTTFFYHIHGKRQSTYPGVGDVRLKYGLRGRYWECVFKDKAVLTGKNGTWQDADGKVIARELHEVSAKTKKGKGKDVENGIKDNPGLDFEEGVEEKMIDLMVAVWCAKTWCNETHEARQPSRSDNATKALTSRTMYS